MKISTFLNIAFVGLFIRGVSPAFSPIPKQADHWTAQVPKAALAPAELTLILCGNRQTIDSCGCGGASTKISVAREAGYVSQILSAIKPTKARVLVVDVGGNLAGQKNLKHKLPVIKMIPVNLRIEPVLLTEATVTGVKDKATIEVNATAKSVLAYAGTALTLGGKEIPKPTEFQLVVCKLDRNGKLVSADATPIPVEGPTNAELTAALKTVTQNERVDLSQKLELLAIGGTEDASASKCGSCHLEEYQSWANSRHAHALDTLIDGQRAVADCLPCHSTTFAGGKGYREQPKEPEQSVTCIGCHADGGDHAKKPFAHYKDTGSNAKCITCHTPKTSPKFNLPTYRLKVHDRIK